MPPDPDDTHLELVRVRKRLEIMTSEYNKLSQNHADLQRQYNLMLSSGKSEGGHSFPERIMAFIASLYNKSKFSDVHVTFADDETSIPAHWFVLDARGFVYSSKEDDSNTEYKQSFLNIDDVTFDVGSAMVKWVYTDDISLASVTEEFLVSLLVASFTYCLVDLKTLVQTQLIPLVHVGNVIRHYQNATQCEAESLRQHCSTVLFFHWKDFTPKDFEPLDAETLLFILKQRSNMPLHEAIRLLREDVVFKYLIEYLDQLPAALNVPDEAGDIPLSISLATHQKSVSSMLISHGADVNMSFCGTHSQRQPLLHHLIQNKDPDSCNFLIAESTCNINIVSEDSKKSGLHLLSEIPDLSDLMLDFTEALIGANAEVNAVDSTGNTPLLSAIKSRNEPVFSRLVTSESLDTNLCDGELLSPVWWAINAEHHRFRNPVFSEKLIEKGAKINTEVTSENIPFLHYCAQNLLEDACLYLVAHPCDLNQVDSQGATLLHIASSLNLASLVSALLNTDANANLQTNYIPAEKPRPPSIMPTHVATLKSPPAPRVKKTKIVKKKVIKYILKPQPQQSEIVTQTSDSGTSQTDSAYDSNNPFMDDFGGGDPDTNPFATDDSSPFNPFDEDDPTDDNFGGNPFDGDSVDTSRPQQDPEPQYTEIEEWIDEEVTDDEEDLDDVNCGNSLFKYSADQSEGSDEETVGLTAEASKQTALHLAIWNKNEELVGIFLEFKRNFPDKLDLGVKNSFDQTPFALSLWLGLTCTDALLKAGSDINDCNSLNESLLQQAIMHQNSESAIFLLDRNADFSFRTLDGDSALLLAVRRQLPSVVAALCTRGADMSFVDRAGNVALWVALETGQDSLASILVTQGCRTDAWHLDPPRGAFRTLLHRAIMERNEPAACFLVQSGSRMDLDATLKEATASQSSGSGSGSPDLTDLERQDTPAHMSCRIGLAQVLASLLDHQVKINTKNAEKKTSLHVAIESEHQNCIDVLMTCPELSLSVKDGRGLTPFAYTLKFRNERAANQILQKDPTAAEHLDNRGRSLLHIAVQTIDLQSVLFLITKANVNARMQDKSDMTPLHVAAASDKPSNDTLQIIMRNLILAGANVNAATRVTQTGLHLAADRGSHELCSILLENGADPNIQDVDGNTALHLAVRNRHVYTIKKILALGKGVVDLRIRNNRGRTLLHMLAACSSKADSTSVMNIFPLLLATGCPSLNDRDSEENTVLLLAYVNGHTQLCRALVSRGVLLGGMNVQGHSIFTYPVATTDLLHSLLKLITSEPPWSEHDSCLECGTRFTVTFRRHHCRHCGRVLCNNCSANNTTIPKFHIDKNVRVCNICFHVLKMGGAL